MNHNPSSSTSHRSPSNSLPLLTAITGFVNYKTVQGLLQRSVEPLRAGWVQGHPHPVFRRHPGPSRRLRDWLDGKRGGP